MVAYRLTDAEMTAFFKASEMYVEMVPNYRAWCPVVTIPPASITEWYVMDRFEVPKGSVDGADYVEVGTARTKANANVIWYRYKFNIPSVEVESARRAGVPIWSDNVAVALKQMDMQIAHLILEGNQTWDPVSINGLRDGGTSSSCGTLDALLWDTATKPNGHVAYNFGLLNTAGQVGPFTMVLSSNLAPGFKAKYGAGDVSHEQLAGTLYGVNQVVYLPIGTNAQSRIYPIAPATSDDGVYFMFKKDPSNFRLAEFGPPEVFLNAEMNRNTEAYEGFIKWAGTMQIVQATSCYYDPDVDLA